MYIILREKIKIRKEQMDLKKYINKINLKKHLINHNYLFKKHDQLT